MWQRGLLRFPPRSFNLYLTFTLEYHKANSLTLKPELVLVLVLVLLLVLVLVLLVVLLLVLVLVLVLVLR